MYEVQIVSSFCAAHRLRDYKGKCEQLHGHNYRIHVTARSPVLIQGGMVMDFGDLKKATNGVLQRLDHSYLNEIAPFDNIEPSAENIAAYLFREIAEELGDQADLLFSVSVYESETSRATFIKD
jgi:6-pyruvoyltetrahydropterin/6-carboxytetrahydropterin synthase